MTTTSTNAQLTGDYDLDVAHTRLGFIARHAMVTKVRGSFGRFQGHLHLDGEDPSKSCGQVVIEAASIDTGAADRDQHLRSNEFFDMVAYPEITFHTTEIERGDTEDRYRVTGQLTVKGITRSIQLDVTYTGSAIDPFGNTRVGFEVGGTLLSDFGINWNAALETGGVLVGDKITLDIDISAIKRVAGEGQP